MTAGFDGSDRVMKRLVAAGGTSDRLDVQHPDMVMLDTVLGHAEQMGLDYPLLFADEALDASAAFFLARRINSDGSSDSASTSSKN